MVVKIDLSGLSRKLKGLPRKLNKQISEGSGVFMKAVRKSAKLRAPRDTTELTKSISLKKLKNGWELIVDSPHGRYQEEGFKPHWIHTDMITSNKIKSEGFIKVSKSKPFVKPALEHNLSSLPNILSKSIKRAIK